MSNIWSSAMRFKPALFVALAALLGVGVSTAINIGYKLPSVLPTGELFIFIITSDIGRAAIRATGGHAGMMLAIAIRAFPYSVGFGLISGALMHKLKYHRVYVYSTMAIPVFLLSRSYLRILEASAGNASNLAGLQANWGWAVWIFICIYGWFFVALYGGYVLVKRFRPRDRA